MLANSKMIFLPSKESRVISPASGKVSSVLVEGERSVAASPHRQHTFSSPWLLENGGEIGLGDIVVTIPGDKLDTSQMSENARVSLWAKLETKSYLPLPYCIHPIRHKANVIRLQLRQACIRREPHGFTAIVRIVGIEGDRATLYERAVRQRR
jgi:hypothetical protein